MNTRSTVILLIDFSTNEIDAILCLHNSKKSFELLMINHRDYFSMKLSNSA